MGDLISRKVLLNKFQKKADKSSGETRKILLEVCQSIYREKTAYDIDGVVNLLSIFKKNEMISPSEFRGLRLN
jgi:hypothetical protein